ncbi:succinylglutamate desuccinylase/aspartoacylase family protein [Burkholderia glumae]|uniref:Succinylglutamate desuccinylase/aspartoacylase family protein n=2 Tax=Burkholderia glumae TaxID=337 RepID=A0AAP9Y1R5_BURGL|nr:succinylglutamate desuccinylase/aspartoacylase family protein [Burkholderia glumae]ACR31276.1 Succinylglutamate desuccinylase/aspartoacylase [Burkholderia glumae BGR1]AJY63511.1 succinylglutamate desuccinylase / Aspartoacylase family protein [Burkholderia glumae LMG 2196 = ATCC 33617]KHJ59769.1 deacylase [Burkholderia glumae]MCM2483393.1 succinylglutamate desuccinylase/aspartoacylase family protein [Burkholderia glumae]MCM2511295.1 succinylglutamate desuccinylase/aspartoacylase family prote
MTDVSPRLPNPIRCEIDLDADGKQAGYLRLPHSVHRSAYGWLPVPIASIRNGEGPVVLVMSGNHGDEYEGQVLSSRLMRELTPEAVRGQVIVLPMANFPAAEAGMRTSPLDGGNLNRTFPGDPSGTPTQMIAHYIEHTLLARADYLVDLHSGGSSLIYDGGNLIALDPRDADEELRVKALLGAFGMPRAFLHAPNPTYASAAARRQGAISILTELGGAGMTDAKLLRQGWQGLLHFLGFIGVVHGPLVPDGPPAVTRFMRASGPQHFVYAYEHGVYEPLVELGEIVQAGQPAARIHFPETPLREPVVHRFEACGEVVCRRVPAQTRRGDCLFQLAEPHDTL